MATRPAQRPAGPHLPAMTRVQGVMKWWLHGKLQHALRRACERAGFICQHPAVWAVLPGLLSGAPSDPCQEGSHSHPPAPPYRNPPKEIL